MQKRPNLFRDVAAAAVLPKGAIEGQPQGHGEKCVKNDGEDENVPSAEACFIRGSCVWETWVKGGSAKALWGKAHSRETPIYIRMKN